MSQACAHDHDHTGRLTGAALAGELAGAETRCTGAGERLTPPRRRVLELLLQAGQPVKAYDLISAFGTEPAKPPTVYRALEFLERLGFAHRIESLNAYVACGRVGEGHAAAFLICDCCGATREIEAAADQVDALARAAGFTLETVTIEAHGRCADCRT